MVKYRWTDGNDNDFQKFYLKTDIPVHRVSVLKDSPLYDCLNREMIEVNSYHHQAVKEVSPRLEVMAVSEDGLVEALYMPKHRFLWAVQWHPEYSYKKDENCRKIFNAFISASAKSN